MKTFAEQLRHERAFRAWSQEQVAEMVGTTVRSVSRWERGSTFPTLYFRQKLAELFGKSAEEFGLLEAADNKGVHLPDPRGADQANSSCPPGASPLLWNLPHPRNLLFTGREEALLQLHNALNSGHAVAVNQTQAITGLGGIGKTALALEYAYRYREAYQIMLWIQAETPEILHSELAALAGILHLPEQEHQVQQHTIEAVKQWFAQHTQWLLIVDNLEEGALLRELLPFHSQGKIIVTTRSQAIGSFVQRLDLDPLTHDQGALFLLRRAKRVGPTDQMEQALAADRAVALDITQLVDGLPLALDQAGAYIEEAACSLAHYAALFQSHQAVLLGLRGLSGSAYVDHPRSVRATLALSLERLQREYPAALELLQLCAFLHPEAIPEELLQEEAPELSPLLRSLAGDPLQLDATIAHLRRYSLLQRHLEAQTLSLHRLVQAVVQDTLVEASQREWAERVVRLVQRAFPQRVEYATWEQCQRLLPHALACVHLIKQWGFVFPEAARLLYGTGWYLKERGAYGEALPLYQRALALREQTFGATHPEVAESLNALATLYYEQERFAQALPFYERALVLREQALGPAHLDVAESLNNLAELHRVQGRYDQALPLFERALVIEEQALGPAHPNVATCLSNLAEIYREQRQFSQALPLYQRALAIDERALGATHPNVAISLNNLAVLYRDQGQYAQALPLFERALAIGEQALGPTHPNVAPSLVNLAAVYQIQGRYDQAVSLFERALAIREQALGSTHMAVARTLERYAALRRAMQQSAQAEAMEARARAILINSRSPA